MKGRFLWLLTLILVCCWAGQIKAQQSGDLSTGTLQEQFDFMVNKSSRYLDNKVVPQVWLNTFLQHVQDSIGKQQGLIKQHKLAVAAQKKKIGELETEIEKLNVNNSTLEKEKNSLSFLGFNMNKAVYHIFVWAIIAALLLGLFFFLGRFRYANTFTRKIRAEKEELEATVDQQRKRMLEKEQVLRRQLQDEINKRSK